MHPSNIKSEIRMRYCVLDSKNIGRSTDRYIMLYNKVNIFG